MSSGPRRQIGSVTVDIPAALIGLQILAKGFEKLPDFGHHPFIVTSLLTLGGFVAVGSLLTLWFEKRMESAHALFHVAEGLAIGLSAPLLFEKGKLRIPVILLFVGVSYVIVGYLESRPLARRAELARPMLKVFSTVFIAGGLVLAGFTASRDHDVWAYGAAGLFVAIGAALLLLLPQLMRLGSPHLAEASHVPADEAR